MKNIYLILTAVGVLSTFGINQTVLAAKSVSLTCGNGKTINVNQNPKSPAVLARLCRKAGHPAPRQPRAAGSQRLAKPGKNGKPVVLLLPAVQAAREKSTRTPQGSQTLGSRNPANQAADTTCNGVNACNDMIATCIALGGNVTATSYEPGSGSPDGATCYSPAQ